MCSALSENSLHVLTHLILNNPTKKVEPVIIVPILQMQKPRLMGAKRLVQSPAVRVSGSRTHSQPSHFR